MVFNMGSFKYIIPSIIVMFACSCCIIPINNVGIINRFSSLSVRQPGILFRIPFIESYIPIHTGFDTDFTTNVQCFSKDNILLKFPTFYIDNEFNCNPKNSSCYIDIYSKYFLVDTQSKKLSFKFIPENGMIFKYIHDTMAIACKTITAYQSQKEWFIMYPIIIESLREKVPPGIRIINVRTDRPEINNRDWILGTSGIITNTIYLQTINSINIFNNVLNYITGN